MDMAIRIKKDIIGLDISMDDILAVHISQSTSKLGNPESNSLFGKGLSRNVKSQISASH
jgi:hypothetical protein